jgi:hypothetical protein
MWPSSDSGAYSASYTYTQTATQYQGQATTASISWIFGTNQNFTPGDTVTGATSGVVGTIVSVAGGSRNGTLTLSGTFTASYKVGEIITSAHGTGSLTAVTMGTVSWVQVAQSSVSSSPGTSITNVAVNLRAKQTAPATAADGTLLGQVVTPGGTAPVTIPSSDQTTLWKFIWLQIIGTGIVDTVPDNTDGRTGVTPTLGASAQQITNSPVSSITINLFVSEAQF